MQKDTAASTQSATPATPVPRDLLSFRAAEPINQMIKLEARRRRVTVTRVIADAVALALGRKYPSRLLAWRGMAAAEERTKRRLARAARAASAVLLSKARGVDAGQIPALITPGDQIVEHSVFDVPGGETTTSMLKSPALPVAAQPGSTLEGQ